MLSIKLVKKRNSLETDEEKESYDKKVGALFNEFDDCRPENLYFYVLFFFRRLGVVVIIFFVENPIFRLVISFILSLFVSAI